MPSRTRKVIVEPDSDSEDAYETTTQGQARDNEAKLYAQQQLQMIDLGTGRADLLTSSDKPQRPEDRANVRKLMNDREVNEVGTEAHALYSRNKAATNAWNSKLYLCCP